MFLFGKKPLTACEVGFKMKRGELIVKCHYVLTDTVIMDLLRILVKRKMSHIYQQFHREIKSGISNSPLLFPS